MNAQYERTLSKIGNKAARNSDELWDAIILGAGASGLFCAMLAASRGTKLLLIDHASQVGRKLSITGGGKCNVTNRRVTPGDYHGQNPDFCRSVLARFTPEQLMEFLAENGIELEEREHGQLFCRHSAKELTRLLYERCTEYGCTFAMEERILAVESQKDATGTYHVRTAKSVYRASKVVVALGGPAWPQVGASGTGHEIARAFGHKINTVRPALSGFVMRPGWPLAGLAGIAVPASIRLEGENASAPPAAKGLCRPKQGKKRQENTAQSLPLLFTHNGISGPAALQASLYWLPGMSLELDFLPQFPEQEGVSPLLEGPGLGKLQCRSAFRKVLPDRLCDALLPEGTSAIRCAELGRSQREALSQAFRRHIVRPLKTEGFARAEASSGGVSTDQISSKSLESSLAPGLYFCGEVLDVTGRLGGYNLHWAFASGKAVGESL